MHTVFRHTLLAALLLAVFTVHAKTGGEIYEQAAKSTVVVRNVGANGKPQSMGSGVVLADGEVVTNCHVVKGASQLRVRIKDKEYPATLRYSDWDRDVCSVSVAGLNAPAVMVGSTRSLKVGAKVYAIGAPKGLELTLSDGIVSSLREVEGGRYIQTTAAISPGSSGGGLFDENGTLVGLTTFYYAEGQNLNFAVPVEWVKELSKRSSKAAASTQPVTQWLHEAIELNQRKDWPAMLDHSLRWTKAQPGRQIAWSNLGRAYNKAGQFDKALEAYQLALRINPEDADAWYFLGRAYSKLGQSAKEIEAYQQSLRINPEDADVWGALGDAYGKSGQSAKGIEAYQQALRINPDYVYVWLDLGRAYSKLGQSAKAVEAYQQALRINPEDALVWLTLGDAYGETGQYAKRIEACQQAVRINPEYALAWLDLGLAYSKTGQLAKEVEAYQQALRINPDYALAWFGLGDAYGKYGEAAKSIEAFQQAVRIKPEEANMWYWLGAAYSLTKQRDKALETYKRLKTLNPAMAGEFFTKYVMP